MSAELNLDHNEARALHRIVRAMHDGECPKCHKVNPAEDVQWLRHGPFDGYRGNIIGGWRCPDCQFAITKEEADAVFAIFAPFMEANLAVFEKWRASRS